MMSKFSYRAAGEEYLDNPDVNGEDLEQNLRELKFINSTLGGNSVTLTALKEVMKRSPKEKWFIADVGCGGGDTMLQIAQDLRKKRISFSLAGIDMNEHILRYAMMNTFDFGEIRYCLANAMDDNFEVSSFDIVNMTLFCHHFSDEELIRFFTKLRSQTRVAVVVNDLHRNPIAYYSIKWLTTFFSKSFMVKHDAPLSVLRGFSRKELKALAERSGFSKYELRWCWAFRWKLILWV